MTRSQGWHVSSRSSLCKAPFGKPFDFLMNRYLENPATVLIVNDDPLALDLLRDLLEPEGYKVFAAPSAQRALEITSTVRTDIIICDVVMPGMDGIELCQRLKKDPKTS